MERMAKGLARLPGDIIRKLAVNDPTVASRLYTSTDKRISNIVKPVFADKLCKDPITVSEFASSVIRQISDVNTHDTNKVMISIRDVSLKSTAYLGISMYLSRNSPHNPKSQLTVRIDEDNEGISKDNEDDDSDSEDDTPTYLILHIYVP
jgi:hypothetical protein